MCTLTPYTFGTCVKCDGLRSTGMKLCQLLLYYSRNNKYKLQQESPQSCDSFKSKYFKVKKRKNQKILLNHNIGQREGEDILNKLQDCLSCVVCKWSLFYSNGFI